jgi:hypothetical protein
VHLSDFGHSGFLFAGGAKGNQAFKNAKIVWPMKYTYVLPCTLLLCYPMENVNLEISIIISKECRSFKNIWIKKKIVKENEASFGKFQIILLFEIKSSTLFNYVGPRTC